MAGRAAQIKPSDWRTMVSPTRQRSHHVKLIEIHRALENIASRQSVRAFEIKRTENLAVLDHAGDVGSILRQPLNAAVGKRFLDV